MKLSPATLLPLLAFFPVTLAACGGDATTAGTGATTTTSSTSNGGGGTGGDTGGGGSGAAGGSVTTSNGGSGGSVTTSNGGSGGAGGSTTTTGSGGSMALLDPTKDGPYTTTTVDDQATSGDHQVPVHCVYPTGGPDAGPYPVVVIAHGFQLPASQYYGYAERLATFGYVALTADFPTSLFQADNPGNAADLIAALDWAAAKLPGGTANANLAGITGHSLGGKLSLLAATKDSRFKASIVLDPVDGGGGPGGGCQPPGCVDVSALMPTLNIPTGFLGETTDSMGGFQPCAPAAENFATFYAGATSPSLSVTVIGANHMSFLDDVASCGFTCNFCNAAALDNATVNNLSRAYVVSFYERHLRNNAAYDTYLTGAKAQELWVTPGTVTLQSK